MSNRAFAWEWLFLLCSEAELEASHLYQSTAMWMCERSQMKSQFPHQTSRGDYFVSATSSWHHPCGWSSCFTPNRSATLYYTYMKHQHFFFWVRMNTVSAYLFAAYLSHSLHNRHFKYDKVGCKEWVHYLLQLSALFTVLCQSSTGLPLNTIRLRLWLFAFLIIAEMLFEACDKLSTTPSHSFTLGLLAHT